MRLVVALVALEAVALGLKAWQDRQSASHAAVSRLQAEAALLSEHIQGRVASARTAMALADRSAAARSGVVEIMPGVELVVTLRDAMQSPEGSRLHAAAETAARLVQNDRVSALSAAGDVIVVSDAAADNPVFALAPADGWMPRPSDGRLIALHGETSAYRGETGLQDGPLSRLQTGADFGQGFQIVSQACAPADKSDLVACAAAARPALTLDDAISLLVYALLFAAPVFAIAGLMSRMAGEEEFEEALQEKSDESARLMSLVTNGAEIGYWEARDGFTTIDLSDKAAALLGGQAAETMTLDRFQTLIHEDDRAAMADTLSGAAAEGWVAARFRALSAHNERWLEMRGGMSPAAGGASGEVYGGILMDVTEQTRAERRTKLAERRLRSAIETFSGPFALWDRRKRLLYWNRAYATTFGLEDALRPGVSYDTVAMTRASAVAGETVSEEDGGATLYDLKGGCAVKLVERPTAEGGLITVGVDVTDDVRKEHQLTRQQQKLKRLITDLERSEGRANELAKKYNEEKARAERAAKSKSSFLANMSHELRTPLNAINGFSEILANELYGPHTDKRYKEYAADILVSGQHLLDMINEILDMAKIEAGKMTIDPRPIDPVDPVDAAVRMVRRKAEDKNIDLVLRHDDDLPDINADHRAIRQMVLNLVSNAIKFTPEGGRVNVVVRREGDMLQVAVQDTGIGIPKEDLPRLGTPFEQVKNGAQQNVEGTGLGLALTKSFAEMHGGRLTIASEVGEGTVVAFYLPFEEQSAAPELV